MKHHYPTIGESSAKKAEVEGMFDAIAPRYDLLNRVLSLGIDRRWRKKAVSMLEPFRPAHILDVATGTGDLAIEALSLDPEHVVGVDISSEMLSVGRKKVASKGLDGRITLQLADAENLPFGPATFDGALVAFGVRNFGNLVQGLSEIARVLRPGGAAVILEFSQPETFPIKQLYRWYSRHVLPRIGGVVSGDSGAYKYLPDSVAAFPYGESFARIMREAGFEQLEVKPLTLGIVTIYKGVAA